MAFRFSFPRQVAYPFSALKLNPPKDLPKPAPAGMSERGLFTSRLPGPGSRTKP